MINVTIEPPIDRKVTMTMLFSEALALRKFLGNRFSTSELRAAEVLVVWQALSLAGVDSE